MEYYLDHKQECLWACNIHWVMNSNEKAIMKFHHAIKHIFLPHTGIGHLVLNHKTPYPEGDQNYPVIY